MTTYRIISNAGQDMGTYEADSEAEALNAMARDAGYADQSEAAEVAGPFDGTVQSTEERDSAIDFEAELARKDELERWRDK